MTVRDLAGRVTIDVISGEEHSINVASCSTSAVNILPVVT